MKRKINTNYTLHIKFRCCKPFSWHPHSKYEQTMLTLEAGYNRTHKGIIRSHLYFLRLMVQFPWCFYYALYTVFVLSASELAGHKNACRYRRFRHLYGPYIHTAASTVCRQWPQGQTLVTFEWSFTRVRVRNCQYEHYVLHTANKNTHTFKTT